MKIKSIFLLREKVILYFPAWTSSPGTSKNQKKNLPSIYGKKNHAGNIRNINIEVCQATSHHVPHCTPHNSVHHFRCRSDWKYLHNWLHLPLQATPGARQCFPGQSRHSRLDHCGLHHAIRTRNFSVWSKPLWWCYVPDQRFPDNDFLWSQHTIPDAYRRRALFPHMQNAYLQKSFHTPTHWILHIPYMGLHHCMDLPRVDRMDSLWLCWTSIHLHFFSTICCVLCHMPEYLWYVYTSDSLRNLLLQDLCDSDSQPPSNQCPSD